MRPKWEPTTDMLTKSAWGEGGLLEEEKKGEKWKQPQLVSTHPVLWMRAVLPRS